MKMKIGVMMKIMDARLNGILFNALLIYVAAAFTGLAHSANVVDIVHSKLSGDNVQINIVSDDVLIEPGSFSTDTPARIALDFFGVKSQLPPSPILVEAGKVRSVVAIETSDRTRVIINLFESARYRISESENGYSVLVFKGEKDLAEVVPPKPFAAENDVKPKTSVTGIDFRRSDAGGGTLIVDLNNDKFAVDTREQGGEIVVDLLGVELPAELEQSLDVVDFATPVKKVDSFQNSDNVRLVVVPQGKFQHLSFQSGGRFTLIVDPIIELAEDLRNQEDLANGYEGERLSINFQNIEVRSALAVIADFTGLNFVTSDTVDGDISINLKNIPWDQALDVILQTKGLSKREKGSVIWVAPSDEIQEFEAKELEALATVEQLAPLTTEIIQINYAKARDIAEVVNSVRVVIQGEVSSNSEQTGNANVTETDTNTLLSPRGSVTVDERTNSLLIQDVKRYIDSVRKVIAKLDKPVRQVLIETRIVEANDNFSKELGARLGFQRLTENAQFPGANDSNLGTVIGGGSVVGNTVIQNSYVEQQQVIAENELARAAGEDLEAVPGLEFDKSIGQIGGLSVDLGASSIGASQAASYAIDILKAGAGFNNLITLELSALEADGRGKVVASPRLVTSNQSEARISQGSEIFITATEAIEAELELTVTPQITPDDRVILDVFIEQDRIIQTGPLIIGTKEIETQILAENGETVVIGGIYQESESKSEVKVPILGDIPVLGNFFKKKSQSSDRVELLIFLTPKIISPKLNLG